MGRRKKKIKEVVPKTDEKIEEKPIIPEKKEEIKIAPFSGDFQRQDINSLMDKVNEIIAFINK